MRGTFRNGLFDDSNLTDAQATITDDNTGSRKIRGNQSHYSGRSANVNAELN